MRKLSTATEQTIRAAPNSEHEHVLAGLFASAKPEGGGGSAPEPYCMRRIGQEAHMARRIDYSIRAFGGVLLSVAALCTVTGFVPSPSPGLITHGDRAQREVALTFDADPGGADPRIIAELRRSKTRATFFVTGLWTEEHRQLAHSLAENSLFEIANHTYDHRAWEEPCYGLPPVVGTAAKQTELLRAASTIAAVTGIRPRYFRFPGGCQDEADVQLVKRLGEKPVQWDVISGDSYLGNDVAAIDRQIISSVRPGSIIVMHLNGAPR